MLTETKHIRSYVTQGFKTGVISQSKNKSQYALS